MFKDNGLMIFLIVAILGVGWGTVFLSQKQGQDVLKMIFPEIETSSQSASTPASDENENEEDPTLTPTPGPDFSEQGNLVKPQDDWVLVYEEPGQPALTVVLEFDEESRCDLGDGFEECDWEQFENGMRVEVTGWKDNDALKVDDLEIL